MRVWPNSMVCTDHSHGLAFPWQPNSQNFLPSILPCDSVTIGRAVDETDVDANQRRSIRGHHLSTNDTSVPVYRQRNVTIQNSSFLYSSKVLKIKYCTRLSNSHNRTAQLPSVSQGGFYWEWEDNEIRKLHFVFTLIKKRVYLFHYRIQESKIIRLPIVRLAWVVFKTQVDFQDDIRPLEYTLIRYDHQSLQSKVGNHPTSPLIWLRGEVGWPHCQNHILSHLPRRVLVISTTQLLAATSPLGHGYFLILLGIKHCHKLETINTAMLAAALNMSLPEARSFTYTTLVPRKPVLWKLGPVSFRRPWVSNTIP